MTHNLAERDTLNSMVICRICKTEVEKYANGTRCRNCYNSYMTDYMVRRYHARRIEAIKLLGGKCAVCNTTEKLELDHIDRTAKTFDIGKLFSRGKARYLKELELCQLLCYDCHKEKTFEDAGYSEEHGKGLTGKRNCRCALCGPLKKRYMQDNGYKWK